MKRNILLGLALACSAGAWAQKCGMQAMHEAMIANNATIAQRLNEQKNSLQGAADAYLQHHANGVNYKTTVISPIPVVFHIVVTSAQLTQLGGTAGVARLCDSQIAVLNRDYNRENADSTAIPAGWKSLYGNPGIRFGLAHTDPAGNSTPGYEIKVVTTTGFSNIDAAFPEAKTAATGLAAWDVTKYYNVWCLNFTGAASTLLGIAVPKSETAWGTPVNEMGVCIFYKALGKTKSGDGTYYPPYNLGRTLTHETGHFFEIWHTWGDDNGDCPWNGGQDDGLADTPPQSDATYGAPAYTLTGGTKTDACQLNGSTNTQPIGFACLSFMDYTDDGAMHMFTAQQAATMAAQVLVSTGENYSLTQHPELLQYPTAVTNIEANTHLNVYPNPTTGQVTVSFNSSTEKLNDIVVMNMLGQQVIKMIPNSTGYCPIDLSGMSKGIYVVKCNFASGSVTRKIMLQ